MKNGHATLMKSRSAFASRAGKRAPIDFLPKQDLSPESELDFIKLLAHDIKSPLHNMKLCLEIMKQHQPQLEQDEYFQMLNRSLWKLQDMARTLLDYQLVNEEGKLCLEVLNVKELVLEEIGQQSVAAGKRSIAFEARFEGMLSSAYLDRVRVSSVLSNLLENAIKYSPEGSTIEVLVTKQRDSILFEICDEGMGVPVEFQDRLFKPLPRIPNRPQDGTLSHGLGLALCYTLVRSHGGTIGYSPREQKGSCFYFRIPQQFYL